MAIVTETTCPLCGAVCTVGGGTTQHYIPESTGDIEKLKFHEWASNKNMTQAEFAIARSAWEDSKRFR